MALNKYKVGDLIELIDERNSFGIKKFYGININKEFMPTAANTDGLDESKYKVVRKERFVFSGMQTGRDQCIRISMFSKDDPIIVSPAYTTFEIKRKDLVMPYYFFMFFKSSEKDRLGAFYSDGSIRTNLDWERFCDIEIELPDLATQEKFVKVYLSMLENQRSYERGLDDLKLVCDGYIENLKKTCNVKSIGTILKRRNERNSDLNANYVGISRDGFIEPKQELSEGNILHKKVFYYDDFIFTPSGVNLHNKVYKQGVCSHVNEMFYCVDKTVITDYLELWLKRDEFYRYCNYFNISSVMSNFNSETLLECYIPIPSIDIQHSIVEIYSVYKTRKQINEQLKDQIKNICPILIKGSIEEAR